MVNEEWSKKYKDVRWQKKRLRILQRDNWTCQFCNKSKNITLHVHHLIYVWNQDPWDYKDAELVTLCGTCHTNEFNRFRLLRQLTYVFSVEWRLSANQLQEIVLYFHAMAKMGKGDISNILVNLDLNRLNESEYALPEDKPTGKKPSKKKTPSKSKLVKLCKMADETGVEAPELYELCYDKDIDPDNYATWSEVLSILCDAYKI